MGHPPYRQEQRQEPAIQPSTVSDMTGFQVPAAALALLKGGFHACATGVLGDPLTPCRTIRDQEPAILIRWLPHGTQMGLQTLFLPKLDAPAPRLSWFGDELTERS